MGLGGFFNKIGSGVKKGAIAGGKVVADVADIPGVTMGVAMIPVAGPWISLAMNRVNQAEELFSNQAKSGKQKMEWATAQAGKDFKAAGIDNHRLESALSLALLLMKNEALFVDAPELVEQIVTGKAPSRAEVPGDAPEPKPKPRSRRARKPPEG